MTLLISENHSEKIVNVKKIIDRIIRHLPPRVYEGLSEIAILDNHHENIAFACYQRKTKRIELYLESLLSDLPWILKKSYFFPFMVIGMALGHELDHHVNRNAKPMEKELLAETNALKYVYPSLGIFKPLFKLFAFLLRKK